MRRYTRTELKVTLREIFSDEKDSFYFTTSKGLFDRYNLIQNVAGARNKIS